VTITGIENPGPANRRRVAWNMLTSPKERANCFGKARRDAGHSRVPDPPHMITG